MQGTITRQSLGICRKGTFMLSTSTRNSQGFSMPNISGRRWHDILRDGPFLAFCGWRWLGAIQLEHMESPFLERPRFNPAMIFCSMYSVYVRSIDFH